jgi:hypothetical protein
MAGTVVLNDKCPIAYWKHIQFSSDLISYFPIIHLLSIVPVSIPLKKSRKSVIAAKNAIIRVTFVDVFI